MSDMLSVLGAQASLAAIRPKYPSSQRRLASKPEQERIDWTDNGFQQQFFVLAFDQSLRSLFSTADAC